MHSTESAYHLRQISQRANDLFERAWRRGQFKRIQALFTGESRHLPLLSDIEDQHQQSDTLELGVQPTRLERIIGTQGKISFDKDFLPLQRRSKARWVAVAQAMLLGATNLPPVDVVQVGDDSYIKDGNHRVSVAKALNYLYIDADVTRWAKAADSPDAAEAGMQ